MSGFLRCLIYIAALGALSFVAGRLMPKRWFDCDALPYRELPFENGGHFYRKLGIHRWQGRVPDMSRLLPWAMPPKSLKARVTAAQAERMVQETCVAEFIHAALCLAGLACLWLWPGPGGALVYLIYALAGNLPFILIQRFNRPKLKMLAEKCRRAEARQRTAAGQK